MNPSSNSRFSKYTIDDITRCLDVRSIKWKRYRDGVQCGCPLHDGKDPNCIITPDDDGNPRGYCFSHCGFFWPDEAFPELKGEPFDAEKYREEHKLQLGVKHEQVRKVKEIPELQELWRKGLPLPPERIFPEIPNSELENLGWKWVDSAPLGMGTGVLIPYWTSDYNGEPASGTIGFCQVRHLSGQPRFSFPRGMSPTLYGTWVLRELTEFDVSEREVYLVEGSHDQVVLTVCAIPAVAVPSASSKDLVKQFAKFCTKHQIRIVYAGDNDDAGSRIRATLDDMGVPYRARTAPHPYKDIGDFARERGLDAVRAYFDTTPERRTTEKSGSKNLSLRQQEKLILDMFPGSEVLISGA